MCPTLTHLHPNLHGCVLGVSECWMFYTILTARVIFTAKTSLDVFSLSREQVWTFSVFGDRIYEMRCLFVAVGPSHIILTPGQPVMFRGSFFILSIMPAGTTTIFNVSGMTGPSSNWESNPQNLLVSAGSPLSLPFTISRGS